MHDVIIVLGGGVGHTGVLPPGVMQRCKLAYRLYRDHKASRMIASGLWAIDDHSTHITAEAEAMARYLVKLGADEADIFIENRSRDTIENAFFCKELLLNKHGWKDILVVTSDFHVRRVRFIFAKILGPKYKVAVIGAPSDLDDNKLAQVHRHELEALEYDKRVMREISGGDDRAIRKLLFYHHPFLVESTAKTK